MELTGKIEEIRQTIQRTPTFMVREFVIEVENQRNQQWNDHILFQTSNNNCVLLDNFQVGQTVKITFDIQGRRWKGNDGTERVFNTLSAWRIEAVVDNQIQQPTTTPTQQAATPTQVSEPAQSSGGASEQPVDDLPF